MATKNVKCRGSVQAGGKQKRKKEVVNILDPPRSGCRRD